MPPTRIDLDTALPDDEVAEMAGTLLTEEHFHILIDHDVDVFKPNGDLLLKFRRHAIPKSKWRTAADSLRSAAAVTDNRGNAGGIIDEKRISNVGHQSKVSFRRHKRDGTISKTHRANPVKSGIVGCFDRYARTQYCRLTAFNLQHPTKFRRAMPFIKAVDEVFARELPERHAAQMTQIKQTHLDFYLHGTSFTTITVNKNWQTAVHQDAGDYKPGFGCMAAVRRGQYDGCYLCFPKYRVAVDMNDGDVLLADVHEWHGNTPLLPTRWPYERISFVFYYRAKMLECGSAAEELERAKALGRS